MLVFLLGIGVWVCFWKKARTEPLTVSEQYWIAALPYTYGTNAQETSREEVLQLPKETGTPEVEPPSHTTRLLENQG